jgi:hypothetical protein
MTYTFYCEDVPHTTRYAFDAEYKTRTWLHKAIKKLEAKGHTVEVCYPRTQYNYSIKDRLVYETGKGFTK